MCIPSCANDLTKLTGDVQYMYIYTYTRSMGKSGRVGAFVGFPTHNLACLSLETWREGERERERGRGRLGRVAILCSNHRHNNALLSPYRIFFYC